MTQIINNVDLDKIAQTTANGWKDKSTLRKHVKLQGEWNLNPSNSYQFRTELSFEEGKELCESYLIQFLGPLFIKFQKPNCNSSKL